MKNTIYLDYQASTPVAPRVLETLHEAYGSLFGNPSSQHRTGLQAKAALDRSRRQIARFFQVAPDDLHFTSGATEANNLAIKGLAAGHEGGHVITVATEHSSVLAPVAHLAAKGLRSTVLPIDGQGNLDLGLLEASIRPDTFLISAMMVNNETGKIHPVEKIAAIARKKGALFHCDATQGIANLRFKPKELGIDLMSVSGHKIYGPKGVGLLYVDSGRVTRDKLGELIHGGPQEHGLRAGTENLPAICGLATAFQVLDECLEKDREETLRKQACFLDRLAAISFARNGSKDSSVPSVLNLRVEGVTASSLMRNLDHLQFSTGSACSAATPSHVLTAMGLPSSQVQESFRIGFGRLTSLENVKQAADEIVEYVRNVLK